MNNKVLIIVGATATGKSCLAIELAKKLNGEIVSADSMQLYKFMDIGTAKPSAAQRVLVRHHMINILQPHENYSVAQFSVAAEKAINDVLRRKKIPIVVGGTGLYVDSIINNTKFFECDKDSAYRDALENMAKEKGNHFVHAMLLGVDKESYERIFPNDLKKVIRALEVYKITGKTITEQHKYTVMKPKHEYLIIGIGMDRRLLYERIEQRVDTMLSTGLLEEVKFLLNMGISKECTSMQAIGYKELADYLENIISFDEACCKIKRGTKRYAKRQLTWFRKNPRINWLALQKDEEISSIAAACLGLWHNFGYK